MSKRIVITGTSRGIGFELAQLLANAGHEVVALSRKIDSIQALEKNSIHAISTDLSEQSSIDEAAKNILDKWDRIDILIHNAGMLVNKPFEELTPADFQQCYAVNVFGVASLTQALMPAMNKHTHVVAISSMGGIQGSAKFPGLAAYSSAKAAVITLFELLAEEYKENGPSFNTLALGAVQTEMLEEAFPGYKAPLTATEMASYIMDFALTGHKFYNGKTLQVSASTP
ncbi:SDR family oxidoreductase [Nonlabens sp. Ci31]|jgi:NAD(P)-dependent dehydrogenase (short-subunit alcohol dehydrogenase family)|uniref:SDR family NAD(P)-dependent oxidoreductase n=1 Tax=Nonlabens sp. Ci31 TaxID=2608253 RepID=UPI001463A324|nr:SDR family oxidoreductase [Nonlabens sp. Ci31]QJP33359.1 SDR family oxidoreductase [Nonlabens sp. Ci31]